MEKLTRTLKAWWWFFLIYLVFVVAILAVIFLNLPSQYTSKTKIFVSPSTNSALADIYDAPYTDRAVKTVVLLADGDAMFNSLSTNTGVDAAKVKASIRTNNVTGTQIIEFTITNHNSEDVTKIANAIPDSIDGLLSAIQANTESKNQIQVSVAETPSQPKVDYSDKIKTSGLIFVFALLVGYIFVLFLDPIDNTLKNSTDVEKTGTRFLGEFGHMNKIEKELGQILKDKDSAVAEAMREIRTNIIFDENNSKIKTIAITSPGNREGKTAFTAALGLILSESDKRVVIIDANLKSPGVGELFAIKSEKGLVDYFSGNAENEDIINKTKFANLWVIPAGKKADVHLSTLLSRKSFPELKKWLINTCEIDYILIDSPSIGTTSDTTVIAKNSDSVIVVVEHGRTSKADFKKIKASLGRINAHIVGAVVSKVRIKKS